MKVLLLEDDEILNEVIENFLIKKGYEVYSVFDGEEAEDLLSEKTFDLLLLDVNVPFLNGFDLLKNLRENMILTPAIFITSLCDAENLRIGFRNGCDDYIKKPFDFEELELRIENIKRLCGIEQNKKENLTEGIEYDFAKLKIAIGSEEFLLGGKESKILEYFLKNRGRIISLEELKSNIWSYVDTPTDSTIRTYIKNLRKIIGAEIIVTIKGVGYSFKQG